MFETLKKNIGVIVYIFIITILFFSCTKFKIINSNTVPKKHQLVYDENFKIGAHNFVFLLKDNYSNSSECETLSENCMSILDSTASGLVFTSDNASIFVITAAHFCSSENALGNIFEHSRIIGFANDQPRILNIIKLDKANDLCMLHGVKYNNEDFFDIKLAKNNKIGESIYSVAAPLGIASPGNRLIFTGHLGGCNEELCTSTFPATFGSSGAGIYNSKNELISIIMAVPESFDNVVLSPSNLALKNFIDKIDLDVDIYNE